MQYTRPPQFFKTQTATHPSSLMALIAAMLVAVACALFTSLSPAEAYAKSYEMPQVDIKAQLETDGTLHVVEQRTFDFDGSYSSVWWTMNLLPSNAEFSVNSVRMMAVDDSQAVEGSMTALSEVPFDLKWREKGGPGKDSYSIDSPKNTVYVFFGNEPKRVTIELDYTITNMAQLYDDVAEVYWRYVGSSWAEDSLNVTATLQMPLPQGATVEPGENVHAWGHGPLDGEVSINADGSITCTVPKIRAGEYAEVRACIPSTWFPNVSLKAQRLHAGEQRLDTVLKEERQWADTANSKRMMSFGFSSACALVCVALLVWALVCFFRFGKEYQPDFTGSYWKSIPGKGVHPAVIGRLWRWNRESDDDLTVAVVHLANIGAIRVESGTYEVPDGDGGLRKQDDITITKVLQEDDLADPIDKETFKLLFDRIAQGQNALWVGTMRSYACEHGESFANGIKHWQEALAAETDRQGFFEEKGKRLRKWVWIAAAVVFILSIALWKNNNDMLPLLMGVPTAAALTFIGNNMPRRTVEGNNLIARCKALRNWLRDFPSLDEPVAVDERTWRELMVYAYLFGVSKQAIGQLKEVDPQLFTQARDSQAVVPWWAWYMPASRGSESKGVDVCGFLSASFTQAIDTAHKAMQAANGSSSSGIGAGGSDGGAR